MSSDVDIESMLNLLGGGTICTEMKSLIKECSSALLPQEKVYWYLLANHIPNLSLEPTAGPNDKTCTGYGEVKQFGVCDSGYHVGVEFRESRRVDARTLGSSG